MDDIAELFASLAAAQTQQVAQRLMERNIVDLVQKLRDQGLQLGHSDLTASGPLGRHLRGHVGAVFETHDGKLEKGFEEVFIETTSLPYGLQARAGRFASQIGYLNQNQFTKMCRKRRSLLGFTLLTNVATARTRRSVWTIPARASGGGSTSCCSARACSASACRSLLCATNKWTPNQAIVLHLWRLFF